MLKGSSDMKRNTLQVRISSDCQIDVSRNASSTENARVLRGIDWRMRKWNVQIIQTIDEVEAIFSVFVIVLFMWSLEEVLKVRGGRNSRCNTSALGWATGTSPVPAASKPC